MDRVRAAGSVPLKPALHAEAVAVALDTRTVAAAWRGSWGWARGSGTVDKHYIDPTVLPTPAAYDLWGWALTRQYTADAGVIKWHEPLPDPALEAP